MRRLTAPVHFAVFALGAACVGPAMGQLVLPGAEPPAPAGTVVRPSMAPRQRRATDGAPLPLPNAPVSTPSVATILGKSLRLNGSTSEIVLEARNGLVADAAQPSTAAHPLTAAKASTVKDAKDPAPETPLVVTHLKLTGELLSKPGEACRIEVRPVPVIDAQMAGHPAGAMRYRVTVASCPFTFDVLDGAILPTKETQSCAFKSADCQVNIGGLWGPKGSEIGPEQIKDLERLRAQADLTARETFRDLLRRTTGRAEVQRVAAEQAAFSSLREETCRTYDLETVHHFCATRLTQARVTALQTELNAAPPPDPKKERKKKRHE